MFMFLFTCTFVFIFTYINIFTLAWCIYFLAYLSVVYTPHTDPTSPWISRKGPSFLTRTFRPAGVGLAALGVFRVLGGLLVNGYSLNGANNVWAE